MQNYLCCIRPIKWLHSPAYTNTRLSTLLAGHTALNLFPIQKINKNSWQLCVVACTPCHISISSVAVTAEQWLTTINNHHYYHHHNAKFSMQNNLYLPHSPSFVIHCSLLAFWNIPSENLITTCVIYFTKSHLHSFHQHSYCLQETMNNSEPNFIVTIFFSWI